MRVWMGILSVLAGASLLLAKDYSHEQYFEHYEGTKTCLRCHRKEAEQFFHSQHYQWEGEAPHIVNAGGKRLGKMNVINDFCTNPASSWIGLSRNSRGEVLAKGCSSCHAGLGKKPQPELSQEQLENIDCLMCHASGYRRDLYGSEAEGWEWKPILWKNQRGLDSVAKRISLPERTMCLRCHANSGGGPNFKRGDLEYKLREADREFDVHMGVDGANLQCIDCHRGGDHRVRGKGTDLPGSDLPGQPLSCDNSDCHDAKPHQELILNHHAERVYCTTCHVPRFAKDDATDMVRDWSSPQYNEALDKHTADLTLQKDVRPVMAWYNGTTFAQLPGTPVHRVDSGAVGMMIPQGSRQDPRARLFPFKLHRARLPLLKDRDWIVPIVVEEFFADGDLDRAVKSAAEEMYGVSNAAYTWVDTVRYMGIFHEVQPARNALGCLDCHSSRSQVDWKQLGYDEDPMEALISARK